MTVAEDAITCFLDLRALWGGGEVSDKVQLKQWNGTATVNDPNYADHSRYVDLALADLQRYVCGRDVLIATHGFNNDRQQGIQALFRVEKAVEPARFRGVSRPVVARRFGILHALCYSAEPAHAMDAGAKLATFVDANLQNTASLSFVSHSLGARVILEAMTEMQLPVRRAIIMAGAVDDHCLTGEFSAIQQKTQVIAALASKEDEVAMGIPH